MSSNTASVIAVIIIGYSITDNMVCTEYKVLSQSSTVVSISFCTEYQCIGYVRYTVFKSVTCFQIPNDDQDTASHKLEQAFLLPFLEGARQNPRTASNAVNKVRDLEVSAKAGAGWAQSGSGHIKLTKSTSMTFSLSVYTVYFCCAAIPTVPPGEKDNVPAAAPHCGAGGPAHADPAAKPLEEVKISTALPTACSRFSLSFYIRFKCSHHDHAFEVMFCFRLTAAFHNLIICSVH